MIEDTFLKLKTNLELSDTFQTTISRMQRAVRSVVDNNHADVKNIKLIGSVGRKTRIQPRPNSKFDIDMLVVFGEFNRWVPDGTGISKEKALENLHAAVTEADRYAKKNPDIDHPTVTIEYENDVTIELVPAWIDQIGKGPNGGAEHLPKGRAYWVPSRTGWQLADYDFEAEYITTTNSNNDGMFIPAVKMLKAAKRIHFPSMSSYQLEVIASQKIPAIIHSLKQKNETATYPKIVAWFLFNLSDWVDQEWGIPGSLSPKFTVQSTAKVEVQAGDGWLRKTVQNAYNAETDAEASRLWKLIFKDDLPLR